MTDDEAPFGDDQAEVIAFLERPTAHGLADDDVVECHTTHGAIVFLAGAAAIKIKRAVHYVYMDFSTLAHRKRALERELEINRNYAPDLYVDVVAVTREHNGALRLGGSGVPVEWALRMRRFEQSSLLSRKVAFGLDTELVKALADEISAIHAAAPISTEGNGAERLSGIVAELASVLSTTSELGSDCETFRSRALAKIAAGADLLERRRRAGKVRRCHGDLHLDNIIVWHGKPTLFDAIEFDEDLATIDTLYDLAFLLMDLDKRKARASANALLNRYLWRLRDLLDLDGLALLPIFLALRAAVRAMVSMQRATIPGSERRDDLRITAHDYMSRALLYLTPPPAMLLAIGGFSGSGKSTLAAALAPLIGPAPGAIHLRSDLERKALFGVDELARLPAAAYTRESSARVYAEIKTRATHILKAGHAVVLDAVFASHDERAAAEAIARAASVPFAGLWLDAEPAELIGRVERRAGDASDATPDVVEAQLRRGAGDVSWAIVDSSGTPEQTVAEAARKLGIALPASAHG